MKHKSFLLSIAKRRLKFLFLNSTRELVFDSNKKNRWAHWLTSHIISWCFELTFLLKAFGILYVFKRLNIAKVACCYSNPISSRYLFIFMSQWKICFLLTKRIAKFFLSKYLPNFYSAASAEIVWNFMLLTRMAVTANALSHGTLSNFCEATTIATRPPFMIKTTGTTVRKRVYQIIFICKCWIFKRKNQTKTSYKSSEEDNWQSTIFVTLNIRS